MSPSVIFLLILPSSILVISCQLLTSWHPSWMLLVPHLLGLSASLLLGIPLSSATPLSSLLAFTYPLLLCSLTTFSDTSLIPHLPSYFMPYFFRDKISQRMHILSPVHTSVLSEGSAPLKLLHTTKRQPCCGMQSHSSLSVYLVLKETWVP